MATQTYISVADADAYFDARGNDQWAQLSQQQKQAALVVATQYINAMYVFEQPIDMQNVPEGLQHATAELALLSTQKSLTEPEEPPIESAEVAGAVSVEFAVDKVSQTASDMQQAYINGLLRGIAHLAGKQTVTRMARA